MPTNLNPAPATGDPPRNLAERPLTVITACRVNDLPILEITARQLRKTVPFQALQVVAPDRDCRQICKQLGSDVRVIPENEFIPGMTIEAIRNLPIFGFPGAAGWYFQQLIKLQFAFCEPEDDYYLIWDADTVPLRPMRFFDAEGRALLTRATEYHAPYFETYRTLLGTEPNREFSFIAQHLLMQKSIVREMLGRIETRTEGEENWAWKIMRSLPKTGDNLFSEYETYGHYVKNFHAGRVRFVNRAWQRDTSHHTGRGIPSEGELRTLAQTYDYVAFERANKGWRRLANLLVGVFKQPRPRA